MTEPGLHRTTTVPPATIRHHINGGRVASGTRRTFENRSPVDGSVVSLVAEAGADEVDAAVAAAGRALRGPWAGLSTADRGKLLHAVADEIDRRFEDFVAAEVADTGMPESFARSVVIPRGAANFRFFADLVKNLPAENFHLDTPDGAGALNYVVRGPKGVIAVICPWEPAAAPDDVEARTRARLRQHRGGEAIRRDALQRRPPRQGDEHRRRARRGRERHPRIRTRLGR